jgi:hypothetical protein
MLWWIGGVFDPKGFDLNRIIRVLGSTMLRPRIAHRETAWVCITSLVASCMAGCSDIPACRQAYSKQGDRAAIAELTDQFRMTVPRVQEKGNLILLSEAQSITRERDFVAMEEWVCRAQKQYGSP